MTPNARRGLELMRALGRSSTAKYLTMQKWACSDGRVRGGLLYHGATTGRWAGKGVQPHNFPKGHIKDMEEAWEVLKTCSRDEIIAVYGSVMDALSQALRGAIVAAPGKRLYVADYAAIEARVLLWLAEDEDALDVFRRGACMYCDMAESIYDYPCNKEEQPAERALGKIAVLGLGYQMGASKFAATCANFGIDITETFAKQVVDTYREKFWGVKELWADQEAAAMLAVRNPYREVYCGYVTWSYEEGQDFLYCELPSGRDLVYPNPEIKSRGTPWGGVRDSLTYMGVNPLNHQWTRQTTYGGMLVENITQAVARDVMAEAMVRCEDNGYPIILTVHDEVIAEVDDGTGNVQEFEQLLAETPEWAEGCPIEAEGWSGYRYRK